MKILEVDNRHAYLIPNEGDRVLVKDVNENHVLAVTKYLIDNSEADMDEVPTEDECPNPAERVIYEEFHKQFAALLSKREDMLLEIASKFEEAEKFYNRPEPFNIMNWAEPDATE